MEHVFDSRVQAASLLESNAAHSPSYQAYQVLRLGFTVAPILFGLDKFFNLMVKYGWQ